VCALTEMANQSSGTRWDMTEPADRDGLVTDLRLMRSQVEGRPRMTIGKTIWGVTS
jgi:hypothetical protein